MFLDIVMILFLIFLSYCLYIQIILPYQDKKRKELEHLGKYLESLENSVKNNSTPRL